jgi:hypothetical protein
VQESLCAFALWLHKKPARRLAAKGAIDQENRFIISPFDIPNCVPSLGECSQIRHLHASHGDSIRQFSKEQWGLANPDLKNDADRF